MLIDMKVDLWRTEDELRDEISFLTSTIEVCCSNKTTKTFYLKFLFYR